MIKLLSYPLGSNTPTFGENPPVTVKQLSSIAEGGVANWFEITTINHNGTHIDAPFHFWQDGPTLTDIPIHEFIFDNPLLIDIPKTDAELITRDDLRPFADAFAQADLLLIRTGFRKYRDTEPQRYGKQAPGFHSNAADVLMAESSTLRGLAMDIPSANAYMHMDEGIAFHQEVLGTTGRGSYIFLIEDVKIDHDLTQEDLKRVLVIPTWLHQMDAAPCTIIAES